MCVQVDNLCRCVYVHICVWGVGEGNPKIQRLMRVVVHNYVWIYVHVCVRVSVLYGESNLCLQVEK